MDYNCQERKYERSAIGARLRILRHRTGRTQAQVAAACDLKVSSLQHWEQGVREIPGYALVILANFYGVSLDYILCQTEDERHVVIVLSDALDDRITQYMTDTNQQSYNKVCLQLMKDGLDAAYAPSILCPPPFFVFD